MTGALAVAAAAANCGVIMMFKTESDSALAS